jgi:hypothetical protein
VWVRVWVVGVGVRGVDAERDVASVADLRSGSSSVSGGHLADCGRISQRSSLRHRRLKFASRRQPVSRFQNPRSATVTPNALARRRR